MAESNGVYIPVNLSVDDAEKQIKKLEGDISKLEVQKVKVSVDINLNNKWLEELKAKRDELAAELEKYSGIENRHTAAENKYGNAKAAYDEKNAEFASQGITPDQLLDRSGYDAIVKAYQDAKAEMAQVDEEWNKVSEHVAEVRDALNEVNGNIAEAEQSGEGLKEKFAALDDEITMDSQAITALQTVGGGALTVMKNIARIAGVAFAAVGKGALYAAKNFNPLTKVAGMMQGAFKRLGQTFRRVFVFSVLTSGARAMREAFSKILNTNSELSKSLKQLKGAFLTAFQPIISAVIPVLTTLVQWLTRAMMAIARLTAGLFGKTAAEAQAGAKALNSEAGAAKKAAKSLAGIDEINKLDAPSGGGGGGASFDVEADTSKDASVAETYIKFLQGITGGVTQLQEAFSAAIPSINEFWNNLYEQLSNPAIMQEWANIGTSIAGLINVGIEQIDWSVIGGTLGLGISHMITLGYNFISKVNWKGFGAGIASFIGGAVKNINWKELGGLIWKGFQVGLDVFIGFVLNFDPTTVVRAFSDFVTGALEDFVHWLGEVRWDELVRKVWDWIVAVITETDWGHLVELIIEGLVNGIVAFAVLIWESIKGIFRALIALVKELFGIHSPSTVFAEFGKLLMEGLANGIKNAWNAVKKVFEGLWNFVKGIINGMLGGVEKMANGVVNGINAVVRALNRLSFTIPDWVPLLGGKKFSLNLRELSTISIPRLAQGTVVPPNREFMAMLGDNKTETEVVSPLSTMKEALMEALAESGIGNNKVAVYVDGRELFDIIVGRNNAEVMRTGKTRLAT